PLGCSSTGGSCSGLNPSWPPSRTGCRTASGRNRLASPPGQTRQEEPSVKRLVALVAAATVSVTLAAAAVAHTSSPPTMQPGKLVVGFGDPAVNFANGTLRGSKYLNPKGYEVDLAAAIAKGLGVTPSYTYTPWAKLFAPGHKSFDISFQE